MNEDVLIERARLLRIPLQEGQVGLLILRAADRHPAGQPALDRRELVLAEVDADRVAHDHQDLIADVGAAGRGRALDGCDVGVAAQTHQLARELGDRQRGVDDAGIDRVARHLAILRRLRILRERDAVLRLDGAQALRAVGRVSRKHDADRVAAAVRGERAKETIDGQVRPSTVERPRRERQPAAVDRDVGVGRDDVDVVRLDRGAVLGLADRHRRGLGQRVAQEARVGGIEVLDEDERHPAVGGEVLEELGERLEPPGRGADADDREPGAGRGGPTAVVDDESLHCRAVRFVHESLHHPTLPTASRHAR